MLRRIGFGAEGDRLQRVWRQLYNTRRGHRIPAQLLLTSDTVIPQVVDEIAFQTRRNLGQKSLADIIRFTPDDERAIQAGARQLVHGRIPDLPPRFLVSASSYALATGQTSPRQLSQQVITHLTQLNTRSASTLAEAQAAINDPVSRSRTIATVA